MHIHRVHLQIQKRIVEGYCLNLTVNLQLYRDLDDIGKLTN